MIIYPAIDLKNGKVVRLTQGDYDQVTQYSESPLEQAKCWEQQGATWLHIVDLDAAKSGQPVNATVIAEIAAQTQLKVQIGGGIRTVEMAAEYLQKGVSRIVVGTQAVQNVDFLKSLGEKFPHQVALGLDTKKGKIAVHGWTETTDETLHAFLTRAPLQGIACLIFTDIARDGMLTGPNLPALREVLDQSPIPVIASGGVSTLQDLQDLQDLAHPNLEGVIVGKALYENKFSLSDALQIKKSSH